MVLSTSTRSRSPGWRPAPPLLGGRRDLAAVGAAAWPVAGGGSAPRRRRLPARERETSVPPARGSFRLSIWLGGKSHGPPLTLVLASDPFAGAERPTHNRARLPLTPVGTVGAFAVAGMGRDSQRAPPGGGSTQCREGRPPACPPAPPAAGWSGTDDSAGIVNKDASRRYTIPSRDSVWRLRGGGRRAAAHHSGAQRAAMRRAGRRCLANLPRLDRWERYTQLTSLTSWSADRQARLSLDPGAAGVAYGFRPAPAGPGDPGSPGLTDSPESSPSGKQRHRQALRREISTRASVFVEDGYRSVTMRRLPSDRVLAATIYRTSVTRRAVPRRLRGDVPRAARPARPASPGRAPARASCARGCGSTSTGLKHPGHYTLTFTQAAAGRPDQGYETRSQAGLEVPAHAVAACSRRVSCRRSTWRPAPRRCGRRRTAWSRS